MTKARFDAQDLTLHVEGHAGAAPKGQDLVCCAISTTIQQLINSLENLRDVRGAIREVQYTMEDGVVHIHVIPTAWGRITSKDRMYYAYEGLELIAESYPKYLQCEEVI